MSHDTECGICARCGETFERKVGATGQQFSWCRPCRNAYLRDRYASNANDKRPCAGCGAECRGQRCRACWTKERPASVRRLPDAHKRRQGPRLEDYDPATKRRPKGRRWNQLKAQVFAEESHCWICAERVDLSLPGTASLGPTVDHVLELSRGGSYWDRSNCRLAHNRCNSQRGAKLGRKRQVSRVADMQRELAELRERVADLEYQLRVARGAA